MTDTRRLVPAFVVVIWVASGDAFRNLIGYPAWGVVTGAIVVWVGWVLWRERVRLTRIPIELALFLTLAVASTIWAVSAPATLLGLAIQLGSTLCGVLLATLEPARLVAVLHWALQSILVASIAFELFVSLVIGHAVFPVWADYPDDVPHAYEWSRDLLLDGGRIQGITGNSNLLAMVALLALIVAACRAIARVDRLWPLWVLLPIATLALTGSATVIVAAAGVGVVALLCLVWVRCSRRTLTIAIGAAVAVAVALAVTAVVLREQLLTMLGRESDLTGRFGIWQHVIDFAMTSPVVGTGFIGYWQPWVHPYDTLAIHGGVVHLMAHQVWLDVFMQLGIVGVIIWLVMQWRAVRGSMLWASHERTAGRSVAIALVPLLVMVAELMQGLAESRPLLELGWILLVAFLCGLARRDALVRPREAVSA